MRLFYSLLLLLCITDHEARAQQWSVFAGVGAGYDGFLADRTVMPDRSKWPMLPSPNLIAGAGYRTATGFDVFGEGVFGITGVEYGVPGGERSDNFLSLFQARLTAGSGPRIPAGEGATVVPFIQVGATFINDWRARERSQSNQTLIIRKDGLNSSAWAALVGAGVTWQFHAAIPSSLNLQCTYTPLAVFREPLPYRAVVPAGEYDLQLQGKLVQVLLSFRVHLNLGRPEQLY